MGVPRPNPGSGPRDSVLFLDVDGVLCCTRVHVLNGDRGMVWRSFDPMGIQALNRLEDFARCWVVVSSTKRLTHTREGFERKLRAAGWYGKLHEDWRTPSIPGDGSRTPRGRECRDWLARHPDIARWAALDDDSDYVPGDPLVLTDPYNGISFQAFEHALALLTGQPRPEGMDAGMARACWPGVPGRPYGADDDQRRLLERIADLERQLSAAGRPASLVDKDVPRT